MKHEQERKQAPVNVRIRKPAIQAGNLHDTLVMEEPANEALPFERSQQQSTRGDTFLKSIWSKRRLGGKVVMTIALSIVTTASVWGIHYHLKTSYAFSLKHIQVSGHRRLGTDDILKAMHLRTGSSIFGQSTAKLEQRLESNPWVAHADILRRLPDTLVIRLREHRAVALIALDTFFLLAEDGTVFKPLTKDDNLNLPVITGIEDALENLDTQQRRTFLVDIVALINNYGALSQSGGMSLEEIHASADGSLSLYVGDEPTLVRLGQPPYQHKLDKLRTILQHLRAQKAKAAYVYLDNTRRPDRATIRLIN